MKKYYWLNKDSKAFLKRGYLEKDESPKQRVADIAKSAEKFLNVKGFAEKFEEWISLMIGLSKNQMQDLNFTKSVTKAVYDDLLWFGVQMIRASPVMSGQAVD